MGVISSRRRACTMLALLALASAVAPAVLRAAGKQPKKTEGTYSVTIGGYYTGIGTITVKNKKLRLDATVHTKADESAKLNFVAPKLDLDGDHFTGTGNIQGIKVQIRGRLDGYADDPVFHGARCLCSYTDGA